MRSPDRQFTPHYTMPKRKGKFYICVTVPKELRPFYSENQIRRSTGTLDKAVANERAQKKYIELLNDLEQKASLLDPFIEGLRHILEASGVEVSEWYTKGTLSKEFVGQNTIAFELTGKTTHLLRNDSTGKTSVMTIKERHEAQDYSDVAALVTRLGYSVPNHLVQMLSEEQRQKITELTIQPSGLKASEILKDPDKWTSGMGAQIVDNLEINPLKAPVEIQSDVAKPSRYSDVIENYLASKNSEASKEQSQRRLGCQRVIEYCGDLLLTEYDQLHAYDLARGMHEDGFSHSMIKKMISYGGGLFKYCLKHRDALGRQLLKAHPWVGIELEEYGVPKRKYIPLTKEELLALFVQEIPKQERLLLTIMITTGMRLDEVALMTWERITTFDDTLCFSLVNDVEDVKVKNRGSMRYIPIPDAVRPLLGNGGEGRLFDYRIDRDGKAQAKASDAVMPFVRNITDNDRKVAHSLRGNFKDLVRDAGVSKEMNDFITGHSQGDVAGDYGRGPSLASRIKVLNSLKHPWLT
jgi:integrase